MQTDGLTGRVSDHLDADRIISTRPKDHGFVRVTHFPWDSPPWGPTRFDRHSGDAIKIPYGEVFEVSVWEDRETIADSYTPSCGATRACELALAVADDEDLPIWNTIKRLRPDAVVGPRRGDPANATADTEWVEIEPDIFYTIPGDNSRLIVERDEPPNQWVRWLALHVETQVAATGETREDVLDKLDDRVTRFDDRPHNAGVVQTPDTLGGRPRINHTRIGVMHVIATAKSGSSLTEIAANFGRELSVVEVGQALDWADNHPAEVAALEREDALRREWVWDHWNLRQDISEEGEFAIHEKLEEVDETFEQFHQETVIRGFLEGNILREEAVAALGEEVVSTVEQAWDAVEEDVEWALESATGDRDSWENSTPTDAGESLFGDYGDSSE